MLNKNYFFSNFFIAMPISRPRILIFGCDFSIFYFYINNYSTLVDREFLCFISVNQEESPISIFMDRSNQIPIYSPDFLESAITKHKITKCLFFPQNISMKVLQGFIHRVIALNKCEMEFVSLKDSVLIKSFKPVISVSAISNGIGKTQVCRYFAYILSSKLKKKVSVIYPFIELDYVKLNEKFSLYNEGFLYEFRNGDKIPEGIFSDSDSWAIKLYLENGANVFATTNVRKAIILAEQSSDVVIYDSRSCEYPYISTCYSFCVISPEAFDDIQNKSLWPGLLNFHTAKNIIVVSKTKDILSEKWKENYSRIIDNSIHNIFFSQSSYTLDDNSGNYNIFNRKVLTIDHTDNQGSAKNLATKLGAIKTRGIIARFPRSASPTSLLSSSEQSKKELDTITETINQSDADVVIVSLEKDLRGLPFRKQILYSSPEIEDIDYQLYKFLKKEIAISQTPPLKPHFEAQVEILSSFAKASDRELFVSNNFSANKGALCKIFLESHMPPGYRVSTGEIIDSNNNKTGKVDIIVVNDSCPTLTFDTTCSIVSPILADNVLTAIEIKTVLSIDQLKKSLSQLRPVKALMTNHSTLLNAGGEVIRDPLKGKILTGIFSYIPGPEIENKVSDVISLYPGVIDFIVLPEYFGLFSVNVLKVCGISVSEEDNEHGYKIYKSRGMSLAILFGILNSLAAKRRFSGASTMKYLNGRWGDKFDQTKLVSNFGPRITRIPQNIEYNEKMDDI